MMKIIVFFSFFYNNQQEVSPYNTTTQSTEVTKINEMITKRKQLWSLISLLKSVRRNCKWIFWGFQKRVKWQVRARLIAYRKFCDRRLLHLAQTCSKVIRRFSAVVRYIHVAIAIALLAWCMLNCSCFFSIAILIVVTFFVC